MLGQQNQGQGCEEQSGTPFKQAEFDIMYGQGISKAGDVLDCAVEEKNC